jgi:putative heme iron utilization protein
MTEVEELKKIKAVVAKPTEEGAEQLVHLMETSAFNSVKVEAVSAIFALGFGPPSKKANEELAVWAEAAGADMDELGRKAKEVLAKFKSIS